MTNAAQRIALVHPRATATGPGYINPCNVGNVKGRPPRPGTLLPRRYDRKTWHFQLSAPRRRGSRAARLASSVPMRPVMTRTIVFIHGNFVTRHCWDAWVTRYDHQVVIYARADAWYIQPHSHTFHPIGADGSWSSWTHTGSSYAALVVRPRVRCVHEAGCPAAGRQLRRGANHRGTRETVGAAVRFRVVGRRRIGG